MVRVDLTRTPFAPLGAHLLDLLHALQGAEVPLVLVGGFGLFLRQAYREAAGATILYTEPPPARATEDFDALLTLSVLSDLQRVQRLSAVLERLNYQVVPGAERYQFLKPDTAGAGRRNVKIDLLARRPDEDGPLLRHDPRTRRIGPLRKGNPLHARVTPEAFAAEDDLLALSIVGVGSGGDDREGTVFLAHPYALFSMKLFAFRDEEEGRKGDGRQAWAQKHARDLATITALLTEPELAELGTHANRFRGHPQAQEAAQIVTQYFADAASRGVLRMQEQEVPSELRRLVVEVLAEAFLP